MVQSAYDVLASYFSFCTYRPTMQPTVSDPGVPVANVATNGTASAVGCSTSNPPQLAIDGTTQTFACSGSSFSMKKAATDKGFEVQTEKLSIITKLRVYANVDCEDCDPISYSIVGVSSNSSYLRRLAETTIATGVLPWAGEENVPRNPPNVSIISSFQSGDTSLSFTEVEFQNQLAFNDYIVTFADNRQPGTDLIVGEVELVGILYEPTNAPTFGPTSKPSQQPTSKSPTRKPTANPVTSQPSSKPVTSEPTKQPTGELNFTIYCLITENSKLIYAFSFSISYRIKYWQADYQTN
jgi:hypothetical protein